MAPASRAALSAPRLLGSYQQQVFVRGRAQQQTRRDCDVSVLASSTESSSSLFTTESSLLGPSSSAAASGAPEIKIGDLSSVPLESEAGVDYAPLRDALQEGEFEKADDITRALLIQLAGEGAVKRGWVYFTEVKFISETDFKTLDALWREASSGKFGYAPQREVWLQNGRQWAKFFKAIDWVQGENNVYRKWPMEFNYALGAPKGHLPLTNALRGTRLFEAIMDHPAFANAPKKNKQDWL